MKEKRISEKMKKVIVSLAQKAACMEANTACSFWYYQTNIPECVKNCVSFSTDI